jgi:hypothetical protein
MDFIVADDSKGTLFLGVAVRRSARETKGYLSS